MWPLCSRPSGSCYFMAPFTQGASVPLSMPYISLFATVSPHIFLTCSVSVRFPLSVAHYHLLFISVTEESPFVCISVSQHRSSFNPPSIYPPSIFLLLSSFPHSHHIPCPTLVYLPSLLTVAFPLLIHHLLLSTDLFAKNKALQLRDRKKNAKLIGICDGWKDRGW